MKLLERGSPLIRDPLGGRANAEVGILDALIVIDMQEGLLRGAPKHDLSGVVERIDRLAARVRERGGCVFFVQHDGAPADDFAPFAAGWLTW